MNIYFVRHGATAWNVEGRYQGWSDTDLTTEGLAQAWRTADFFASFSLQQGVRIHAMYSSPLRRAWRTAAAIADRLHLAPRPAPALAEMHGGAIEGFTLEQWQSLYPELIPSWQDTANLDFAWPGGESRREFRDRCLRAVSNIADGHGPYDNVIVVSHGGVIQSYLQHAGLDDPQGPRPYGIANCSITRVQVADSGERASTSAGCLLALNEVGHLDATPLREVAAAFGVAERVW